jgi:methylmalonyl-CoA mutase N-terminal domain/subunit
MGKPAPKTKGAREEQREVERRTTSGVVVKRLYDADSIPGFEYAKALGEPSEYPFTRGVYPTMYRGRLWTMRQYAGFGSAEETNKRFRYLLEKGQTGLSVAFDLPTQIGYDSDHPLAKGEVGKVGVAICSLADMQHLFKEIALDKVSTSMTINSTAPILLSMYLALAKNTNCAFENLRGPVQNDILKEYIARGTYIYPPEPSMRLVLDVFEYCYKNVPRWNAISVSGYHIREAGSTAVQEVAFTLADAIAYLEAANRRGLDVTKVAEQMSFFFAASMNFLEEVAKFRAARRLWARIARDRFKVQSKDGCMLRFHTQTSGYTLTAQEHENNVVRVALEALSAVLGGTQSLHTNSMDEALSLPSERAVRVALRTQQIIANESGVADVVDPAGGSYCIEALTDEIEELASEYINKIDDMGGMLVAIQRGYVQREIAGASYEYQMGVERGTRKVLGVNIHPVGISDIKRFKADDAMIDSHMDRLREVKRNRDEQMAEDALKALTSASKKDDNLIPHMMRCVSAQATLGEISDALRDVFGEYVRPEEV